MSRVLCKTLASSSRLGLLPLLSFPSSTTIARTTFITSHNTLRRTQQQQQQTRAFRPTAAKMTIHNVESAQAFKDAIKQHKVVLVDFYATWCGPCKMIAPKLAEWSEQFPNIHYLKVDVDELTEIAAEYEIRAMPTFMLFQNGEKVDTVLGAAPPPLQALITKYHPSS